MSGTVDKLMFAVRAKPGLTRRQALDHLREKHGPLVAASFTNRQRLKTYVQNHGLDVTVPSVTLARDWIIESWRDFTVKLPEPPVAPDAIALREDEARFPDRPTLLTLKVVEEPVWRADPDAPFSAAPVKVFTYARRCIGGDGDRFDAHWASAAAELAAQSAFRRFATSFVRNRPVPGDGTPVNPMAAPTAALTPPYDAVDIWRFPDVTAVTGLFGDPGFLAALDTYMSAAFDAESIFRLVTEERVVFDDAGIDPGRRSSS